MKKEIIKVVAGTALCLGLFTASVLGSPRPVQATPTNTTIPPPVANSPATPTSATQQTPETKMPEMTLSVIFESDTAPSAQAMTPEDAAYIGAQYIWDIFGENIDGKMVHMMYRAHESMTRTFWSGIVTHQTDICLSEDDGFANLLINYAVFEFTIDAVCGKRIDIMRTQRAQNMSAEVMAALDAVWNRSREQGDTEELINLRGGGPAPANLDDYKQAAKEIAQIQFLTSEIYDVEFRGSSATGFDLDENGNLIITGRQLTFAVTNSTGRTADIALDELTKQLRWIFTAQNDIDPDFRYEGDGPDIG